MVNDIKLKIGNVIYTEILSYSIQSDIYEGADAFSFELSPSVSKRVEKGMKVQFYVNSVLELTGYIDRVSKKYEASKIRLTITGRNIIGLLVDSCCEEFVTLQGQTLIKIVERLTKRIPQITSFEYDEAAQRRDEVKPFLQIEPGQKIFEVLQEAALNRGLVFFGSPAGGLVFRKPKGRGRTLYLIDQDTNGSNKLIISGELSDDLSQQYSKYTVLSQEQGSDNETEINSIATVADPEFPAGLYKPYVESVNDDKVSCKKRAQYLLEQSHSRVKTITYTVSGHSYKGRNWSVDELVHVQDRIFDINADLLIYGREISGTSDKQTTVLKLGYPGAAS